MSTRFIDTETYLKFKYTAFDTSNVVGLSSLDSPILQIGEMLTSLGRLTPDLIVLDKNVMTEVLTLFVKIKKIKEAFEHDEKSELFNKFVLEFVDKDENLRHFIDIDKIPEEIPYIYYSEGQGDLVKSLIYSSEELFNRDSMYIDLHRKIHSLCQQYFGRVFFHSVIGDEFYHIDKHHEDKYKVLNIRREKAEYVIVLGSTKYPGDTLVYKLNEYSYPYFPKGDFCSTIKEVHSKRVSKAEKELERVKERQKESL